MQKKAEDLVEWVAFSILVLIVMATIFYWIHTETSKHSKGATNERGIPSLRRF